MHNFVYHSLTVVSASAHNHNISLFLLSSFLPLYKWRTSVDANTWERRGVLAPPKIGDLIMDETMSARVYNDVVMIVLVLGALGVVSYVISRVSDSRY